MQKGSEKVQLFREKENDKELLASRWMKMHLGIESCSGKFFFKVSGMYSYTFKLKGII